MTAPRIDLPGAQPAGRRIAPPTLWDPVVRLTHWGIAASVLLNALVTGGGSLIHVSLGWLVMALLLMRLVWGALGPSEARFSAFPPNPLSALRHLRDMMRGSQRDYPSHNPAGAIMAYAFWATLAIVTLTGLVMTGGATPMQVASDKAAVASGDWSALIREGKGRRILARRGQGPSPQQPKKCMKWPRTCCCCSRPCMWPGSSSKAARCGAIWWLPCCLAKGANDFGSRHPVRRATPDRRPVGIPSGADAGDGVLRR